MHHEESITDQQNKENQNDCIDIIKTILLFALSIIFLATVSFYAQHYIYDSNQKKIINKASVEIKNSIYGIEQSDEKIKELEKSIISLTKNKSDFLKKIDEQCKVIYNKKDEIVRLSLDKKIFEYCLKQNAN